MSIDLILAMIVTFLQNLITALQNLLTTDGILGIITIFVAIPPIIEFVHFINRHINSSKLVVGVIPMVDIKKWRIKPEVVLKKNTFFIFGFTKQYIAKKLDHIDSKHGDICSLCKKGYLTKVEKDNNDIWDIPIFLQNEGNRISKDLALSISFRCIESGRESRVNIINVETEGQEVTGIYTQNTDLFQKVENLQRLVPAKVILDTYQILGETSPIITLEGGLESKGYEVIHLFVKADQGTNKLCIVFRLDDPEATNKINYFVQPMTAVRI